MSHAMRIIDDIDIGASPFAFSGHIKNTCLAHGSHPSSQPRGVVPWWVMS